MVCGRKFSEILIYLYKEQQNTYISDYPILCKNEIIIIVITVVGGFDPTVVVVIRAPPSIAGTRRYENTKVLENNISRPQFARSHIIHMCYIRASRKYENTIYEYITCAIPRGSENGHIVFMSFIYRYIYIYCIRCKFVNVSAHIHAFHYYYILIFYVIYIN